MVRSDTRGAFAGVVRAVTGGHASNRRWWAYATGRWILVAAWLCFSLLIATGCAPSGERSVRGEWSLSGPASAGVARQDNVYSYWRFDRGAVTAHACCCDTPSLHGHYRIEDSSEDAVLLLVTPDSEVGGDGIKVAIVLDPASSTATIQGIGPYSRTN